MIGVVREVFRDNPDELFAGDDGVEISCPRCGRRWWVDRARFDGDDSEPAPDPPAASGDEPSSGEKPPAS